MSPVGPAPEADETLDGGTREALEAAGRALEEADAAFVRMDVDALVAQLAAAIRGFTAAGAVRPAAMASARLGDAYANALGNLTASRAWIARAERLVAEEPDCVEQGWVAVAAMGCDVDDPEVLLAHAELALDRARRFGDVNLEMKALADGGLAHVQAGRVVEGMGMLDEAMALACGPADDRDAAAKSVCSFFTACCATAAFERAAGWAEPLQGRGLIGPEPGGPAFLASHCDSVHATLLVELGRWQEAEEVLVAASAAFERAMGGAPAWHPTIALADLRVRQGRLVEAEALLLGRDQHVEALVPAVRLHLVRGDRALARTEARRGLRALGRDRARTSELLALLVQLEVEEGDLAAAESACAHLEDQAAGLTSPPLQARVARARARLLAARGDGAGTVAVLEEALAAVEPRVAPWPHATLLLALAAAHEATGEAEAAAATARAAAAALAPLDVVVPPEERALLDRHAPAAGRGRSAAPRATEAVLQRERRGWSVRHEDTVGHLTDTKGVRHLARLVASPGVEHHALDLVDREEGIDPDGPDRRALGDAGPLLDASARTAYRRRIEQRRAEVDDALAAGRLDAAERLQGELDQLVGQLAAAFGLGGRDRRAGSAVERARLNVTRALRTAVARVGGLVPEAGAALDRGLRTGTYCCYDPAPGEVLRWRVEAAAGASGDRSSRSERTAPA